MRNTIRVNPSLLVDYLYPPLDRLLSGNRLKAGTPSRRGVP